MLVTVRYRLGAFGYMARRIKCRDGFKVLVTTAHPTKYSSLGHENIAAFGGDADNVTMFGDQRTLRASTISVSSPAAAGLFHRNCWSKRRAIS